MLRTLASRAGALAHTRLAVAAVVRTAAVSSAWGVRQITVDAALMSEAAKNSQQAGTNFAQALLKELTYEKENFKPNADVAEFLKKTTWKIEDSPGMRDVYLKNTVGSETINVTLGVMDPDESLSEEDQSAIPVAFSVQIAKEGTKNAGAMVLQMSSLGGQLDCTQIFFDNTPDEDALKETALAELADYPGPKLSELDETLQQAIIDYLASRGINEDLGNFIEVLYYDKEQREYMKWLSDLSDFIKK